MTGIFLSARIDRYTLMSWGEVSLYYGYFGITYIESALGIAITPTYPNAPRHVALVYLRLAEDRPDSPLG